VDCFFPAPGHEVLGFGWDWDRGGIGVGGCSNLPPLLITLLQKSRSQGVIPFSIHPSVFYPFYRHHLTAPLKPSPPKQSDVGGEGAAPSSMHLYEVPGFNPGGGLTKVGGLFFFAPAYCSTLPVVLASIRRGGLDSRPAAGPEAATHQPPRLAAAPVAKGGYSHYSPSS